MVAVCFQLREREIDHGYHKVPARVGVFVAVELAPNEKCFTVEFSRLGIISQRRIGESEAAQAPRHVHVEQLSSKDWTYPHARGGVRRRESFRPLAPSLSPRMWG